MGQHCWESGGRTCSSLVYEDKLPDGIVINTVVFPFDTGKEKELKNSGLY